MSDLERERREFEEWALTDSALLLWLHTFDSERGTYYNDRWELAWKYWKLRAAREDALVTLLRCIVEWDAEYRKINNLGGGGPDWVARAEAELARRT